MRFFITRSRFSRCRMRKRSSRARNRLSLSSATRARAKISSRSCRSASLKGRPSSARTMTAGAATLTTVMSPAAAAPSSSCRRRSSSRDNGRKIRPATSAILRIPSPGIGGVYRKARGSGSVLDAEAIHARPNLVAAVHLGVAGRQRIEERAVAAAEVADADRAVGVGHHLEVLAGEKLVWYAHVAFPAHDQSGGRNLELLPFEQAVDAHQPDAFPFRLRLLCPLLNLLRQL